MDKPSVSVAITALNEGATVAGVVKAVLKQTENNFELSEVIVYSDGSTDKTVPEIRQIADKRVILLEGRKRKGKAVRHGEIFKMAKGKIIVLFDADIVISSSETIANLIRPFLEDINIGLVGGNSLPQSGRTFIEKAVNSSFEAYEQLRAGLRGGNNVFSCNGTIMALSREYAGSIVIPKNIAGEDHFLYFECLNRGFKFKYVPQAKVWYRSPASLKDQIRQSSRFIFARQEKVKIFGRLAEDEYFIPKKSRYWHFLRQFLKRPIESLTIFFINRYCRYVNSKKQNTGALWAISETTKGGLNHVKS